MGTNKWTGNTCVLKSPKFCKCSRFWSLLRCYPAKFGLKLVELFHSMIADKRGMPELPAVVPSAEETFASLEFDDVWSEAHMVNVCHYLRAGVHLKIPPSFRGLLPTKL